MQALNESLEICIMFTEGFTIVQGRSSLNEGPAGTDQLTARAQDGRHVVKSARISVREATICNWWLSSRLWGDIPYYILALVQPTMGETKINLNLSGKKTILWYFLGRALLHSISQKEPRNGLSGRCSLFNSPPKLNKLQKSDPIKKGYQLYYFYSLINT